VPENPHGAAAAAMGYLFQCRYALLEGLRAVPDTPQLLISIEKFDDVGFESNGEPTALVQTKHHIDKIGDLSDSSVDLWKTISVWVSNLAEDIDAPFRMRFALLTTAAAPDKRKTFGGDGFDIYLDKVVTIEKQLGIYDLKQFTPR
jgi:hypothetical protein